MDDMDPALNGASGHGATTPKPSAGLEALGAPGSGYVTPMSDMGMPIDRSQVTLRAKVRQAIWALIMTGRIETDRLYSVRWLSEQLEVSATPIREALMDLAHDGVVEVHRSRGFLVPVMSDEELDGIAEIRTLLELPTLERLAGNVDAQTLAECRELAAEFERGVLAKDPIRYLRADQSLHLKLLGAGGNERLVRMIAQLREQTRLYGLQQVAEEGRLMEAAREHVELLDAVERGDREAVRRVAEAHLRHLRGVWVGRDEDARKV
ncbi:MAG TPA: GntR family transcriptional regulator [Solirubrobacter sp.]|nr:GntR family transcriptional regulator [Solirubrobacter sp.]